MSKKMNYLDACVKNAQEKDVKSQAREYAELHKLELEAGISDVKSNLKKLDIKKTRAVKNLQKVVGTLTEDTAQWLKLVKNAEKDIKNVDKEIDTLKHTSEKYKSYIDDYFTIG